MKLPLVWSQNNNPDRGHSNRTEHTKHCCSCIAPAADHKSSVQFVTSSPIHLGLWVQDLLGITSHNLAITLDVRQPGAPLKPGFGLSGDFGRLPHPFVPSQDFRLHYLIMAAPSFAHFAKVDTTPPAPWALPRAPSCRVLCARAVLTGNSGRGPNISHFSHRALSIHRQFIILQENLNLSLV